MQEYGCIRDLLLKKRFRILKYLVTVNEKKSKSKQTKNESNFTPGNEQEFMLISKQSRNKFRGYKEMN